MGLVDVLSVIIGIIFIWMLLGVAVMQIQEWTVGWLALRADSLEDAIRGMLSTPKQRHGPWGRFWEQVKKRRLIRWLPWIHQDIPPALVQTFYRHPLIRSFEQQRAKPSYLSADCFSQVLLDTVMVAGLDAQAIHSALTVLVSRWPESAGEVASQKLVELIGLANEAAASATKQTSEAAAADDAPNSSAELRKGLGEFRALLLAQESGQQDQEADLFESVLRAQLPRDVDGVLAHIERGSAELLSASPLLQQRLEVLARQAAIEGKTATDKLAIFQRQIEGWFDETMDHVTGWYKRNRQWGAFAIGLLIAAFLNLDSIHISTVLWRQPALREAVAAAAAQELEAQAPDPLAQGPGTAVGQLEGSLSTLQLPVGWQFLPLPEYDPASQACRLFADSSPEEVGGLAWNGQCYQWQDAPKRWGILIKLMGIIITAAAAMQGAPFWFDVLDKIVPIRAAGIRPGERSANSEADESMPSPRPK